MPTRYSRAREGRSRTRENALAASGQPNPSFSRDPAHREPVSVTACRPAPNPRNAASADANISSVKLVPPVHSPPLDTGVEWRRAKSVMLTVRYRPGKECGAWVGARVRIASSVLLEQYAIRSDQPISI